MLKTPYYLLEEERLEKNLKILDNIQKESGAKILDLPLVGLQS